MSQHAINFWLAVLLIVTLSFAGHVAWSMIAAKRFSTRRLLLLATAVCLAATAIAAQRFRAIP